MASFFLTNLFTQQNYIKHLLGTKTGNIKQNVIKKTNGP